MFCTLLMEVLNAELIQYNTREPDKIDIEHVTEMNIKLKYI
jgi:hypothetical protein